LAAFALDLLRVQAAREQAFVKKFPGLLQASENPENFNIKYGISSGTLDAPRQQQQRLSPANVCI